MGFIMDGLDAESYDRSYSDKFLVQRIVKYFRPHIRKMLIVAVTIALTSLFDTGLPIVISAGIDQLAESTVIGDMIGFAFVIGGLACFSWLFNYVRRALTARVIGDVVQKVREDAFDAVLERDLSFYDVISSGKIVSRVMSDTQSFSNVVTLTLDLVSQILLIVLLIGYLFTVDVSLTFALLLIAPFIVATALAFRKIARQTVTNSRRIGAVVSSHIQETVSGIRVAKTFRQEHAIYDEFLEVNKKSYDINLRTGYVFSGIFPLLTTLAGFGTAALVYFGGRSVINSDLSPGDWYLFIQGISLFWFPLTSIASFWSQFQLGLAASERVFALLDAEPKVVQTDNKVLDTINGEITFDNVMFRYDEKEQVLSNFSLTIPAGETLALVGHTGAGKSSIGKLVARFYEFQEGNIYIDGHDIRSFELSAYRQHLGVVTQSPFLFDGTVRENIRYGRSNATDEEVEAVAYKIGNGDWIKNLPHGLSTEVGERGGNLSMGQRQLVSLARVMLQNPSIFILDEATASVDPLTEAMIQEGLDTVLKGRTAIVIAHRLSTIRNAHRIIVLDRGRIIEQGTHEELLEQDGHYADLYNTYFRHQSLSYIENAKSDD